MRGFLLGYHETCEKYNPTTNQWQNIAKPPQIWRNGNGGCSRTSVVALDNKIYSFFGIYEYEKQVYVYDSKNDSWSRGADIFKERHSLASVVL